MIRSTSTLILKLCLTAASAPAVASPFDGLGQGDMTCGHGEGAFVSPRTIDIKAGELSYAAATGARSKGREDWSGVIDADGDLVMTGAYAWKGGEKPVWLKGRIVADRLEAAGVRGPKTCVLSARRKPKTAESGGPK